MRLRLAFAAFTLLALAGFHLQPSLAAPTPPRPQASYSAPVASSGPTAESGRAALVAAITAAHEAQVADLARFYAWASALPAPHTIRHSSTPRPSISDMSYDAGSVQQLILDVFGSAGPKALAVARCESGYNPAARNGQYVGIFQLGNYHRARAERLGFTWEQVSTEAYANVMTAHDLYLEQGWGPWSCA